MSAKISILLTGATGYLGGSLLERLLAHPDASTFSFTAIVRAPEKAAALNALGVNAVIGNLADLALLEQLASSADVVLSMADCDDLPSVQALLRGVKARYAVTGVAPIFIHTSGAAVLMDLALGAHGSPTVYSDLDAAAIATLPDTQIHRNVDLAVHAADRAGYAHTFIVAPPNVFGTATGDLVARGVQNSHSQITPILVRISVARRRAVTVGVGANIWGAVHITDTRANVLPHGEGYYFGENGEYPLRDLVAAIGEALVAAGRADVAEPTQLTPEEIKLFLGPNGEALLYGVGSNARCRADRARKLLGWAPVKTVEDMLAGIPEVVEAVAGQKK